MMGRLISLKPKQSILTVIPAQGGASQKNILRTRQRFDIVLLHVDLLIHWIPACTLKECTFEIHGREIWALGSCNFINLKKKAGVNPSFFQIKPN